MWNKPTAKQLFKMPKLNTTDEVPAKDKIIQMHFFVGGSDWYAVEFDLETGVFFGFTIINNDFINAEWGYFNLRDLYEVKDAFAEVDRDLHFKPCKAIEVEKIRKAQGWENETMRKIIIYSFWERLILKIKERHARKTLKKVIINLDQLTKVFKETTYTIEECAEGFKKLGKILRRQTKTKKGGLGNGD